MFVQTRGTSHFELEQLGTTLNRTLDTENPTTSASGMSNPVVTRNGIGNYSSKLECDDDVFTLTCI